MKSFHLFFMSLTAVVLAVSSCANKSEEPKPLPDAEPIVLKSEYEDKTISNRLFSFDLFKTVIAESKGANMFISPYSVNIALNMVWNGTAGETEEEMRAVLGNGEYTEDQINDYAKTLTDGLLKADPTTELKIANSIWAHNTTPFKPGFVQANKTWYDAEVKNVDFTKPETLKAIDKWCMDNTAGKIDKISEGMTDCTKFALINATYFKAKWKYKFDKSLTRDETFTNSDGTEAKVRMMNQTRELFYADDEGDWKMVCLPYGNQAFSMVILMPYDNVPLDAAITTLTTDKFFGLFTGLDRYQVTVKLPKFTSEYKYELHKEVLPAMGMQKIFNPFSSDMSRMCEVPMYVNMVMHKTYIDVYEEGTEAAAATSVSGVMTSFGPGTPVDFFVDRPFIYSIVENSTGTILFMGRINKF